VLLNVAVNMGRKAIDGYGKESILRKRWIWAGSLPLIASLIGIGLLLWIGRRGVAEIKVTGPANANAEDAGAAVLPNEYWPCWRGAGGDARREKATGPLNWSDTTAVVWKTEVPGRGHSSPIIWGEHVFLTTADEAAKTLSVLCIASDTGKLHWATPIYQGPFMARHEKNSHASATPACDGRQIYAAYAAEGNLWLSAVALDGKLGWKTSIGPFVTKWGYGSSPTLYKDLVIVAGDNAGDRLTNIAALTSYLAAVRTTTGEIVWRVRRPRESTFGAPVVAEVSGRPQLLLGGADRVTSYDPANGAELWSCGWSGSRSASAIAFTKDRVFATTDCETICVQADGVGDVTGDHRFWRQKKGASDIPSPLYHDGLLFLVNDKGLASCLDGVSGKVIWHERLEGNFSASPLLVGDRLYATNEQGATFVLKAGRQFELLATNQLRDEVLASPVPLGNRLLLRSKRFLWCVGADAAGRAVAAPSDQGRFVPLAPLSPVLGGEGLGVRGTTSLAERESSASHAEPPHPRPLFP
jgi:outer membrane protein assembly factor BamB